MEKIKYQNKKFFLDVFNNILDYNDSLVVVIFDINGGIWFGFSDLLKMLGYTSIDKTIQKTKINNDFKLKYNKIQIAHPPRDGQNICKHNKLFINESGLYEILTKSTKPTAKLFLNKYLTEIMPEIRKTGNYISNKNDLGKIKKLNDKIDNYKTELNYYDNKYNFIPSEFGYIYINEDNQIKNGIKIKCFKVGFDLDMNKRNKEYKVGNFKHKLLAYIPLKTDRKQIEKCVKTRLKPHLTKLITDTVCYINLKELKKEIIDCINFTNQHICHCIKCSKIYKLDLLDKHNCNIQKTYDIIDYNPTNNIQITSNKISTKISKKSFKKSSKKLSKKSSKKSSKKLPKKLSKKISKKSIYSHKIN